MADGDILHPSTGGAWVPIPNPFGGAPLAEYRSNGQPGGAEARPIGVTLDQLSGSDAVAYQMSVMMFDGATLDEAKANFHVFSGPTQNVLANGAPIAVGTLDAAQQAAYLAQDNQRAQTATAAMTALQRGRYQATTPAGSGDQQPPPNDPQNLPPIATPVVTPATSAEVLKLGPNGVSPTDPIIRKAAPLVLDVSSHVGDTNTGNTATDPAPGTLPASSTSVTGGSVTAADLGKQTNASPAPPSHAVAVALAVAAAVCALILVASAPGSGASSGGAS